VRTSHWLTEAQILPLLATADEPDLVDQRDRIVLMLGISGYVLRLRVDAVVVMWGHFVVGAKSLARRFRPICRSWNCRKAGRWPWVPAADGQAADTVDAFLQ
jgi:hypothetical protein